MTLWHWVLLAFGLYALCGVGVATMFMQTPYADNGWLIIFLLWPLFLFGG